MSKRTKKKVEAATLPAGVQTVTDLAQIRALADPLRLKILGALSGVPRTTKQVALVLGEKPTKLYHHVEALERVGLIHLTETKPNRGTVEKYFQAAAAQFQVAASALSPGGIAPATRSAQERMLTSILDMARQELLDSLQSGSPSDPSSEDAPLVARVRFKGSKRKVQAARRRLLHLIAKMRAEAAETSDPVDSGGRAEAKFALTMVFCPTTLPR